MCQMNVIVKLNDKEDEIIENVTRLEASDKGINISSLFDDSKFIPSVYVSKIDFMSGAVTLTSSKDQ